MKAHSEPRNPIPNPRGTQTVPQPKPATPRSPDGRFAPGVPPPSSANQGRGPR